jgi:hypothetical protein
MLMDEYVKNVKSYTCCEFWASHIGVREDIGVTACDILSQWGISRRFEGPPYTLIASTPSDM